MRYLWELYPAYLHDFGASTLRSIAMAPIANYLRLWDVASAARVETFVANSWNVRKRIWKTYRRRSRVVCPPVAVHTFFNKPAEDYFLIVGEMVAYKQLDYAVRLFARNGRKLKIVGNGPEYNNLRTAAVGGKIEFCGRVSDSELRDLYARSRALLVPGEEDFGIATVEALASGKPVIALGRGGSVEILRDTGGILYDEPTEDALDAALHQFDRDESRFNPFDLAVLAADFSEDEFIRGFRAVLTGPSGNLHRIYNSPTTSDQISPYHRVKWKLR
jgi:glycosyltransferase involved in cell wall biosynthesis